MESVHQGDIMKSEKSRTRVPPNTMIEETIIATTEVEMYAECTVVMANVNEKDTAPRKPACQMNTWCCQGIRRDERIQDTAGRERSRK